MKDLDYISQELAFEIVNHTYEEVSDTDSLTEIIKQKLSELIDEL